MGLCPHRPADDSDEEKILVGDSDEGENTSHGHGQRMGKAGDLMASQGASFSDVICTSDKGLTSYPILQCRL